MKTHTIDATNKKLGRLSTEVAVLLMGKDTPKFSKNTVADVQVIVTNTKAMDIPDFKKDTQGYKWYSGFPGGLRFEKLKDAILKKGHGEVLRRTVYGMLPTNKLRRRMIQNLVIND